MEGHASVLGWWENGKWLSQGGSQPIFYYSLGHGLSVLFDFYDQTDSIDRKLKLNFY